MAKKNTETSFIKVMDLMPFKVFNPKYKECVSGTEMMILMYILQHRLLYIRKDPAKWNGNTVKIDAAFKDEIVDRFGLTGTRTYERLITKMVKGGIFYRIKKDYFLVNPYAFCKGNMDGAVKSLGIFRRGNIYLTEEENPFLINSIDDINKKPKKENVYKSKGEEKIASYLDFEGLEFEYEYTFDECRHKNLLHFDFAVIHNGAIVLLIEFDGPHHFGPQKYKNITDEEAELNYKEQVKRDREKDKFARRKSIPLLRIPYYDEAKIDTIIFKELYRLNILQ